MTEQPSVKSVTLDLRGHICPATLLKSLKQINDMKGELKEGVSRLTILTDHRDATVTVPEAAANMGYAVSVSKQGRHYLITVESAREKRPGIRSAET